MTKRNYVEKEEFLHQLGELKRLDEVPEKLHLIFYKMAQQYATINSFRNYTYIEDMIVDAYINCVVMAKKFDIEKGSNPFAYFTTVIHRNFLNYIAKEKKQQSKKWIELRALIAKYKMENNVTLPLPKNIMDKVDQYL